MAALEAMLAEDVELHGGGRAPALARPLYGRRRVAAALSAWLGLVKRVDGIGSELVQVNGEPGVLVRDPGGAVLAVWAIGIAGDRVQSIRSVVNPDKLGHLGPVGTITDVLERARRNRTPQEYGPPG